tara:strand:- start:5708 stop:5950 length:243 start_codon:yes stop_codon:yes gene_type:complete
MPLSVELPDEFVIVAPSADEIVKAMTGLDWDLPNDPQEYMRFVARRYSITGSDLLFWDELSFLEACHAANILILNQEVNE